MSLLFRNLRIHQIFGANTGVGKTVLTTALARASASEKNVFYLKPVSTGAPEDADDKHVQQYTERWADRVFTECLYRFHHPVSPHLAVKLANSSAPSNETFIKTVSNYIRQCSQDSQEYAHMYVETAGGVHSPTLSGLPQVDAYRPLFLPTVLIGDAKLGGISTTISAYEALLLRGFIVDVVLMFKDPTYRNAEYLSEYFAERGVRLDAFPPPPELLAHADDNFNSTDQYYSSLSEVLSPVLAHLDGLHSNRIVELESMPQRTRNSIWWPFVQHAMVDEEIETGQGPGVGVIDSAYGDFFSVLSKDTKSSMLNPQLDGSASWWTQGLGRSRTRLTLAAARAAGRYGHVIFPRHTHAPALHLSEHLLSSSGPGSGWASRVFFSDNGSTAMEVALKMALRTFSRRAKRDQLPTRFRRSHERRLGVIGLKGSYHGDTGSAMDACEESGVYTCEWHDCKGYWFEPPRVFVRDGRACVEIPSEQTSTQHSQVITFASLSQIYDISSRLNSKLYGIYTQYIAKTLKDLNLRLKKGSVPATGPTELAALVLEPLLLGAGGMIFVDPLFQRALVDVVRSPSSFANPTPPLSHPLPVVFDEVFTGFHRVGPLTPQSFLGISPDIAVYAKLLTGGLVPLAVTLATKEVFDSFYFDHAGSRGTKKDALLHGHSYTAHPIGCEVAREAVDMMPGIIAGNEHRRMRALWKETLPKENGRALWQKLTLPDVIESKTGEQALEAIRSTSTQIYSLWNPEFLYDVSLTFDVVEDIMALGTVLAIRLQDQGEGYASTSAETVFRSLLQNPSPYSIHFRTLGNVAYFMTSLNTKLDTVREVQGRIWDALGSSQECRAE
ncbi:hypothetical protein GYMLUDRAFT_36929 [Collybiopsis luxurians FD-317 M1]|nr:hypothetical protein GYMLUDRAFT_36929 [Collybiopsis luxurians FD-317 M1]